jgi:hypothetical protein
MTIKKGKGLPSRSGWPERLAYLKDKPGEFEPVKTCSTPASAKTIAGRIKKYLGPDFEVATRGDTIYASAKESS